MYIDLFISKLIIQFCLEFNPYLIQTVKHLTYYLLAYSFLGPSKSIYSFGSKGYKIGFFLTRPEKLGIKMVEVVQLLGY